MIPTGIPGFDELVEGLPEGDLVIVAGGPGTGEDDVLSRIPLLGEP